MQMENNFSSSVSFNIFYLVEPNKSVTHTHTHTHTHSNNGLSLCTKGDSGAPGAGVGSPFQASARSFQSIFADAFSCVLVNGKTRKIKIVVIII